MSFTVQDFQDFLALLDLHPEWQEALRRRLISDDFARIGDAIQRLIATQERTDAQLAEYARHTDERFAGVAVRLDQLTERVDALTVRLDQLTERVGQLVESQLRLERSLDSLRGAFEDQTKQFNDMRGILLEWRYDRHAAGYFGSLMRGARSVFPVELESELEAAVSHKELLDFLRIDLLVRGRVRRPEPQEVWLAIEVSGNVEINDVVRAVRRAEILRQTNRLVIPAVAGEQANNEVRDEVVRQRAVLFLNGSVVNWPEALADDLATSA